MNKLKQHLKENGKYYLSPALLACLLLAGLWYWRGVGFAHIAQDIVPERISVYVVHPDQSGELVSAHYEVEAESLEGTMILEGLHSLTLHRPPTNLLYQLLKPTRSGEAMGPEDYSFVVRVFDADGSHAAIQCNVKTWSYDTAGQSRFLPCRVKHSATQRVALGALLWSLAPEYEN